MMRDRSQLKESLKEFLDKDGQFYEDFESPSHLVICCMEYVAVSLNRKVALYPEDQLNFLLESASLLRLSILIDELSYVRSNKQKGTLS